MTLRAACTIAESDARLTAPGARFMTEEITIRGVRTRIWTEAPLSLAELVNLSKAHGDRTFVVLDGERVSYAAHHHAVVALAWWLVSQGVGKGDRVGLAMRNLPEWPVAFFAAAVTGAIVVPLNAWSTGAELGACLADSGAMLLIADVERAERVRPYRYKLPALQRIVVTRGQVSDSVALDSIIGHPNSYGSLPATALPLVALAPDDDATIFYTSGTIGQPKGVLGTHRALGSIVLSSGYAAARGALRRGEPPPATAPKVRLITTPLFHMTGCAAGLIAGMPAGNTNVLMPRWDAGEALTLIERERIQVVVGVPTIAWQLLDHPGRPVNDLSSLEAIAYGGAASAPELVHRIVAELGAVPSNGWGMTETAGTVCGISGEDYRARPHSCGPAVPVAELRVVDAKGAVLPAGAVGELWAKGPMVARGYWQRPEETAATFIDGWVRTGDLAWIDAEGFCTVVDRVKDIVIRGGENIYSSEVEHVLQAHPAVVEAAVLGLPHRTLGEEPVAVVQVQLGVLLSETELRDWVRGLLAAFKIPTAICILTNPLPRNAAGKVTKRDLRALFAHSAPLNDEQAV